MSQLPGFKLEWKETDEGRNLPDSRDNPHFIPNPLATFNDVSNQASGVTKAIPIEAFINTVDDERPYIEVDLFGRRITGLLDSGASMSVISAKVLSGGGQTKLLPTQITLKTANQGRLDVLGRIRAPFRYRNQIYVIDTIVVTDLSHDLILGFDFWKQAGFRITQDVDLEIMVTEVVDSPVSTEVPLSPEERDKLKEAVEGFLITTDTFLGQTHVLEHDIELAEDAKPFYARPHLFSPEMEKKISAELDKMLAQKIVVPSKSPVASPVVPVQKSDGTVRLCLDSRKLNAITVKDKFPVPNVNHILSRIRQAKYRTALDLSKAFWQVPLNGRKRPGQFASAQELTAFIVPGRGLFHYLVMPFGLCNSPATQCRLMVAVLGHDLEPWVFCYVDDIVILAQDVDQMVNLIAEVAKRLREANLSLNLNKCKFFAKHLKFLGFILGEEGLQADPERLKVMTEYPTPRNLKEIRRFLGMTGYYRRLIQGYSEIAAPLTKLLRKTAGRLMWTEDAERAFQALKKAMITAPVVANPNFEKDFILQCDASDVSAAGALGQIHDGVEVVIAFYSHKWTPNEAKWGATEREGACVLYAIKHFRGYLWGRAFDVITDAQALTHLKTVKADGSSRLARWALELNQYPMRLKHRSGRLSVVPDALSRAIEVVEIDALNTDNDEWYQEMIDRLQANPGSYPDFRLEGRRLFKYEMCENDVGCFQYRWKEYVPSPERQGLINQIHTKLCHLGWKKCFQHMKTRFFWPGMSRIVENQIRHCDTCKASKAPPALTRVPMGASRIADSPFRMIALDHWGPVTRSYRGNTYLLVVVDIFSKYVMLHPCKDTQSKGVTKFLEDEVFRKMGTPEVVITDNFRSLVGRDMIRLLNQYGSDHWTIAYYHSQGNPAERYIRTVSTAVRCYVLDQDGDQKKWDEGLGLVQMALNTTVHEATQKTPFFLNFGREMVQSGSEYQNLGVGENRRNMTETQIQNRIQAIRTEVIHNLQRAHQASKARYDARATPEAFQAGESVWRKYRPLSNAVANFSAKLAPKYIRSHIIRPVGRDTYELRDSENQPVLKYHANDLLKDR